MTDKEKTGQFTLHLPFELRGEVKIAAARKGVSMNEWLLEAVKGKLEAENPGTWGKNPPVPQLPLENAE